MIPWINAELWAFNVLNNAIKAAQDELERADASQNAYVKLIEAKYNAKLNLETGEFMPIDKAQHPQETRLGDV